MAGAARRNSRPGVPPSHSSITTGAMSRMPAC
jgi:hypothetical protein